MKEQKKIACSVSLSFKVHFCFYKTLMELIFVHVMTYGRQLVLIFTLPSYTLTDGN